METNYTPKRSKKVKLYVDNRLFDTMVITSFGGRYPPIRIGWRKPVEVFNGVGDSYEQFYFKFEFNELDKDGTALYAMTNIEGLEVETPENDDSDFLVYNDNILNEGIK